MKQISFTRGVARGFSFLVLAMLVLGGMNALVMNRITSWMDHLVDREEIDVRQGQDILSNLGMMHRTLKNLIISPDPQIMERYSKVLTEMDGKIQEGVEQLSQRMGKENNALLAQFRTAYEQYAEIQSKVLELARDHTDQRAANLSRGEAQQAMELVLTELDRIFQGTDGSAREIYHSLERNLWLLQRAEKNALLARSDEDFLHIQTEMETLELNIARLLQQRSLRLAGLDGFENRLQDYTRQRKQVVFLARQRSNTVAFELSIGEGRHRLDGAARIMNTILSNINQEVDEVRQQAKSWVHGTFLLAGLITLFTIMVSIVTAIILLRGLTERVRALSGRAISIAMGIIPAGVGPWPRDELTAIDGALNEIVASYKLIAQIASRMAEGEHPQRLTERSPEDLLIRSINRIMEKSEWVVKQVQSVAQGHFTPVMPVSERDVLGLSLAMMTDTLHRMDEDRRRRLWLEEGYGRLNEIMREEHPLPVLASRIVTFLCQYLQLPGGILFLTAEEEGKISAMGHYLIQREEWDGTIVSSNLALQAVNSKMAIHLSNLGEHHWMIPVSLGTIRPLAILAYPLLARNQPRGVLELLSLGDFSEDNMAFLQRVGESIAITLEKVAFDNRMRQTLDATQALAKELEGANQRHVVQAREMSAAGKELAKRNRQLQDTRDELKKQAEQLRLSGQYKSAFMATMSHEIRTPLNGILGTLQLLERTSLSPTQMGHISILGRSARALLTLLNDLLDLASIEAGKVVLREENFILSSLIEDVIHLFQPKAREKGLELRMELTDGLPDHVRGDGGRLRQILLNLLGNGVKFTNSGWVVVAVERVKIAQPGEGGRFRFTVRDSGMGIASQDVSGLFQPFVQADEVRQHHLGGTGLGLSICHGLVTAMGGEIGVESTLTEGACFWFEIPLTPVAGEEPPWQETGEKVTIFPLGLDVLLVEDEESNRHVAQGMLEVLGCTIHVAENGHQALELFRNHPVAVVLLDMQLPGMDGMAVAEHLRHLAEQNHQPVAIVAMTALTMAEDLARYQSAKMDGFVAKPILLNKLAQTLANCVQTSSPPPLLDGTQLASYRRDLPAQRVADIVQACRQTMLQGAGEIALAWQNGDHTLVGRIAHRLKGTAAANGLVRLAGICETLEREAKLEQAMDLAALVNHVVELVPPSLQALDEAFTG